MAKQTHELHLVQPGANYNYFMHRTYICARSHLNIILNSSFFFIDTLSLSRPFAPFLGEPKFRVRRDMFYRRTKCKSGTLPMNRSIFYLISIHPFFRKTIINLPLHFYCKLNFARWMELKHLWLCIFAVCHPYKIWQACL